MEAPYTVIILNHTDSINDLKESDVWNEIEFTLTYPEYTVQLAMDYKTGQHPENSLNPDVKNPKPYYKQ